jgi:PAS domain S-box-containing protein
MMANREVTFEETEFIVSKTDLQSRITYGNALFIKLSGYEEKELLGKPHNILRHPDMPKLIFKMLWDNIQNGREIFAYVKNMTKEKDYYWAYAHVTPSYDEKGKIIGYHSVRRKPTSVALSVVIPLYQELLSAEKNGGVESSKKLLESKLQSKGIGYDEFIFTL